MNLTRYTHIIWDWNGTLLNDAWLCVEVMNSMLAARNLPVLTLDKYRSIFDFPVRDYYLELGFDFQQEPFKQVGMEFMIRYNERRKECDLFPEVPDVLTRCKHLGFHQFILSAREQRELIRETIELKVNSFFTRISGLDDHYAHGKTETGFQLIRDINTSLSNIIFIGDTIHDAEVADELGVDCVLIPNGHHSSERIHSTGVPVFPSLYAFKENLAI